ncbi:uncharacterized protein P8A3.02c [Vicia villosa]|uniref:uncharacterized protein P8A3.02c n=1 Tax=Vicia villosa TaxID=3911 RepID=UPI00273CB207|nr:uncharacterized protein P8A3.02c [Vicia villosa]
MMMMGDEDDEEHQRLVLEQVFGPSISDDDTHCDGRSDSDTDMEEQHQRTVLEQVFGHSSSDEENDDGRSDFDSDYNWEPIEEVKGLWMLRNFLSIRQQSRLLSSIESEQWFTQPSINQAMRFGYQNLPHWAIKLSHSIRRSCSDSSFLPPNLLQREPLFDQIITNLYQPGEGISPHVDLLRFEDAIAIVSLESSCVMHFTLEELCVPVLLTPGSLVIMFGDARYLWKHEINRKPGFQSWKGELLNQSTRTSVTLRKLCSSAPPI